MNTTLLFTELLINGLQVSVWLTLATLTVIGTEWLAKIQLQQLAGWEAIIVLLALSFFYTLGIIFDRLADFSFSKWERRIRNRVTPGADFTTKMRFELGESYKYFEGQFEYTKSRVRIARSSSLNFLITTIMAMVFVALRFPQLEKADKLLMVGAIFISGSLLTLAALYAWYKLQYTYLKQVKTVYEAHTENLPKTSHAGRKKK